MQTFVPYESFKDSARCLDYRRLGKQRVECKQILRALEVPVGGPLAQSQKGWRSHPAVLMWRGHEMALCDYAMRVCEEWVRRGYNDSLWGQFHDAKSFVVPTSADVMAGRYLPPHWLGDERVHASHRSNLLRKLPEHYSRFGWSEPDNLPYFWPTAEGVLT